MAKRIANILTGGRILGSILLLFFPAFSLAFYIVYLLCGFSDMIDGTVARKKAPVGLEVSWTQLPTLFLWW